MVIYMESCHSGSMFTQLPDNIHGKKGELLNYNELIYSYNRANAQPYSQVAGDLQS